jgi:uncharacterized Tic20 family protein
MSEIEGEAVETQESMEERPRAETRKLEAEAEAPMPRPRRSETKKLDPEPEVALEVAKPAPHLGLTREELGWAAVAHASILLTVLLGVTTGGIAVFLGPIVPAVIWYIYRDRSDYVVEQARQATVFQVAGILALLGLAIVGAVLLTVGWVVSAVLVIVLVGLILLPIMLVATLGWVVAILALPIAQMVYGCYAAIEAYNGRPFRYRWIADQIDRYQAQA